MLLDSNGSPKRDCDWPVLIARIARIYPAEFRGEWVRWGLNDVGVSPIVRTMEVLAWWPNRHLRQSVNGPNRPVFGLGLITLTSTEGAIALKKIDANVLGSMAKPLCRRTSVLDFGQWRKVHGCRDQIWRVSAGEQ